MKDFVCSQVGDNQQECLAACEDQINNVGVTSSDFPNRETFVKRDEFCITLRKLNRTCHSEKREFLVAKFPNVCDSIITVKQKVEAMNGTLCDRYISYFAQQVQASPSNYKSR